jgi:hypothetical protein
LKDYERESFMKMFMDKSELSYGIYFFHPDEYSSIIIDKYVEYLKNKE